MSPARDPELDRLVDDFLAAHLEARPVDATFMGLPGHDGRLPPADPEAPERERTALADLERRAAALAPGATTGERLDRRLVIAGTRVALAELERRPRFHNPAWYTGEAAFGLVSLLLPADAEGGPSGSEESLRARLEAIPGFLGAGGRWLTGRPVPADWVTRARREAGALVRLLENGLPLHPLWTAEMEEPAREAVRAVRAYAAGLENRADADAASGEAHLELLMREGHGLSLSPAEAEELALEGFEEARSELEAMAARLDPHKGWREQVAALEREHPPLPGVLPEYERWHEAALERAEAAGLVTPATDYGLSFRVLPEWARAVAGDLYFLFYRSPAAGHPGAGSVYWVFPPGADEAAYLRGQNTAFVKLVHAVHHGSIGHHTQNTRARAAESRLARLAGTDCASGIALLSGGTMVEGWACHAEDVMAEGFYTPGEMVLLKQFEMRNAATCLADIRLHRGRWTLEEMRRFYADEVGFAPARIWSETTRNSIYPATRLMYWLGTRMIRDLGRELGLPEREYHDALLAHGSVPVAWAAEEMRMNRASAA